MTFPIAAFSLAEGIVASCFPCTLSASYHTLYLITLSFLSSLSLALFLPSFFRAHLLDNFHDVVPQVSNVLIS